MRFKKFFTAVMTASLISVLFVMPVSAHGHHGSQGHHNQTSNTTVTSESTTSGATASENTTSEAATAGATVSDNTDCPVCTVDGCTETGRHSHDGHDYCGYNHENGYCDGSCETASHHNNAGSTTSGTTNSRRCVRRFHCHSQSNY